MSAGLLFPVAGAMAHFRRDGSITLVDARRGWSSRAEGAVATELRDYFAGGAPSERLTSLAAAMPVVAAALTWRHGESPVPLSASYALSFGGFDTLFIELVGQCNERCLHCYASSAPEVRAHLSRDEVDVILDGAAELGFSRVQLTGGDPLLCEFLPHAAEHAHTLGIPIIEIYTNGLALSQRLLDRLIPSEPCFAFSIYSHDPDTHDGMTRTPGSHGRTLAAIRRVVTAGLSCRASIVVTEDNDGDEERARKMLADLGVTMVGVSSSFAVGRGHHYVAGVAAAPAMATHSGRDLSQPVGGKLCVTYEGDVVPCIFSRQRILGNVRERSLVDIAGSPRVVRRLEPLEALLSTCSSELSCAECRLTAAALHMGGGRD